MSKRTCPIRVLAAFQNLREVDEVDCACIEDKCGWWSDEAGKCAVASVGDWCSPDDDGEGEDEDDC